MRKPTRDATRTSGSRTLTLVDDGRRNGGGQLGLARYLEQRSQLNRRLVLLAPNAISERSRRAGVPATILQCSRSRAGFVLAWARLTGEHARRGDDVILANSFDAALVLAATPKRGRTFIYYLREDLSEEWINGWRRRLALSLLSRFDGLIANSAWTAGTIPAPLNARPTAVAPPLSGIGAGTITRSSDGGLRVLSLSRVSAWKGIDVLLDAAHKAACAIPVHVTLAGMSDDPTYLRSVLSAAAAGPAHVTYLGHVDDVSDLLAANDVLVVASRHPEPFGQVVVQGLAAGLSVIASSHGGPVDILTSEELGHLVPPEDADALASALVELGRSQPSTTARQASARRAATTYADPRLARAFESALTEVLRAVERS